MSLIRADARSLPIAAGVVHCCVTSPPYFGLRDYGVMGQIGLEATPDAYVASLVAVFREVWRVLRDDGTCWVNLGDSYATGGGSVGACPCGGKQGESWRLRGLMTTPNRMPLPGLKPKDLIGIPWRVAFALQAPYYAGSVKNREDRIWLAAMLDAEGCMFIHKRKAGQHNGQGYFRQNANYAPGVEIANTSLAVVERIMALVGKGSICSQGPEQTNGRRRQTIYRWNLRTTESRDFVQELYPHLVAKQQQARLLYGCPSSGDRAVAAHEGLMAMHRTGESTVDFPAPPSLHTPGWYLRSDIIWSKANPMPESVTDRPTKAHEYVFLLTKQERYSYDARAIAERSLEPLRLRSDHGNTKRGQSDPKGIWVDGASNCGVGLTRNRRSVWSISTRPYLDAHFATMPEALIEPCILAGCPLGGLVLDPFIGSGTVGVVASRLGRRWVGTDLAYQSLSAERTAQRGLIFSEAAL